MNLAFFDTSVLVYTDDASVISKQKRATELFDDHFHRGMAVLSLQVLHEYFATVTRKLLANPQVAQRKVEIFSRAKVVRFGVADGIASIELHRLTQISFWDAMIVHAARVSGSAVLYSEDFQNGTVLGGVRVINPFIS
jgi:predicted nucleic acid-binding protein